MHHCKYLIPLFIAFLLLSLATPASLQPVNGTWTPNNWLFKAAVGDMGTSLKTQIDTGLTQVDARLSYEVYVTDPKYGAKGDGVTDDTAAIQAAINSGANRVVFPPTPNFYKVSSSLTITNPCVELCGLSKCLPPFGFTPALPAPTTIKATSAMTAIITVINSSNTTYTGYGFVLRNLKLDGNSLATYGLYIYNAPYWISEGVTYVNTTSWGLYSGGTHLVLSGPARANDNYFHNCGNGIYVMGDNYDIIHNFFDYITGWCLQDDGGGDTGNIASTNLFAARNQVGYGCATAFWARRCWKATIEDNYFEMYPVSNPVCVKLGDATTGYQVLGGSVSKNMFSFNGANGSGNVCIATDYISGMIFQGNYVSYTTDYFIKNTGGYPTHSSTGINYLNNSATTYIDQPSTFALVIDNNGNIVSTINSTNAYTAMQFNGVLNGKQSAGANAIIEGGVSGDTVPRWWIDATGSMVVGGNGSTNASYVLFHGASGYMDQVTLNPLTAAPATPVAGMIVRADRVNWDPLSKGSGGSYLVWYDGSAWVSLTSQ